MNKKLKQGVYIECRKCGDKIYYNTGKKMTYCGCKAIAVDGCEFYTRIIGNKDDYKDIYIDGKGRATNVRQSKSKMI